MQLWLRRLSCAYLAALVGVFVLSRTIGEATTLSGLLLYAPAGLFALPLAPLLLGSLVARDAGGIVLQGVAAGMVAGPLMGLCLPLVQTCGADHRSAQARVEHGRTGKNHCAFALVPGNVGGSGLSLRVMTLNIDAGRDRSNRIRQHVRSLRPDVLLLTEAHNSPQHAAFYQGIRRDLPGYSTAHTNQFYLASRYPVSAVTLEPAPSYPYQWQAATLETPSGPVIIVGVHLAHDRTASGLRERLYRSRLRPRPVRPIEVKYAPIFSAARARAVHSLAGILRAERRPLLLLGDLNAPPGSRTYGRLTGHLQDAFLSSGAGWGYTFPSQLSLMRID